MYIDIGSSSIDWIEATFRASCQSATFSFSIYWIEATFSCSLNWLEVK